MHPALHPGIWCFRVPRILDLFIVPSIQTCIFVRLTIRLLNTVFSTFLKMKMAHQRVAQILLIFVLAVCNGQGLFATALLTPADFKPDYTVNNYGIKAGSSVSIDISRQSPFDPSVSYDKISFKVNPNQSNKVTIGICETPACLTFLNQGYCKFGAFATTCTGSACAYGDWLKNPSPSATLNPTAVACYAEKYVTQPYSVIKIFCDETATDCSVYFALQGFLLPPSPPPPPPTCSYTYYNAITDTCLLGTTHITALTKNLVKDLLNYNTYKGQMYYFTDSQGYLMKVADNGFSPSGFPSIDKQLDFASRESKVISVNSQAVNIAESDPKEYPLYLQCASPCFLRSINSVYTTYFLPNARFFDLTGTFLSTDWNTLKPPPPPPLVISPPPPPPPLVISPPPPPPPLIASPPPPTTSTPTPNPIIDASCTCTCCTGNSCMSSVRGSFAVSTSNDCTQNACAAKYPSYCPVSGSSGSSSASYASATITKSGSASLTAFATMMASTLAVILLY